MEIDEGAFDFGVDMECQISFQIDAVCHNALPDGDCDFYVGFGDDSKYMVMAIGMDDGLRMVPSNEGGEKATLWAYPSSDSPLASGNVTDMDRD